MLPSVGAVGRGILGLSTAAVALAVAGLTPGLSWIPEVPLLILAALVPIVILAWTGLSLERQGVSIGGAALGAGIVGAVGGLVAGLAYVLFGKSLLNVPVGLVAGLAAGALSGGLAAAIARIRQRRVVSDWGMTAPGDQPFGAVSSVRWGLGLHRP